MDKREIAAFFDALAQGWDDNQVCNDSVIGKILELGGACEGAAVLDVACGTGVLFPYYLKRGVNAVTGIDISDKMLRIAGEKFPDIRLIFGDAESYAFEEEYDAVMLYNAFPHFANPDRLFGNLSRALKSAGRLTVAHSMSERELEKCHSGIAKKVSLPLPSKERLAEMMSDYVSVDIMISDEKMYMVSGVKKWQ